MKFTLENRKYAQAKKKYSLSPSLIIASSFLIVILIGSVLLYLPISTNTQISYIDALFTSVSATCVTGLYSLTIPPGNVFNLFGRSVLAILMNIGGLGVTTFAIVFFIVLNKKLNMSNQTLIKENWNLKNLSSIRQIFLQVLFISFGFEIVGAFLISLDFILIQHMEVDEAIGYAIFQSISAFNNGGFECMQDNFNNLIVFEDDLYLNLITSFLIISGGIGYFVIIDVIVKKFKFTKFSLHTKVAITYSLFLLVLGTLFIYFDEFNNINNVTELTPYGVTFKGTFFMSVSSRTAGFTMYNLANFKDLTLLFLMTLMFIGASPGSSGGGIKTTTFALLIAYLRSVITGRRPHLFKRSIDDELIKKALLIILLGASFFIIGLCFISGFETNYNYVNTVTGEKSFYYVEGYLRFSTLDYAFDTMSAFSTVGLSTGITPYFSTGSKIVLILLMYIGRVGPLSISTLFKSNKSETWHYGYENISIG